MCLDIYSTLAPTSDASKNDGFNVSAKFSGIVVTIDA